MIQNRALHIMVLIVAMTIGAAMGAQAKSIETSYAIEHFEGSQWRVEKFGDGPTARGFTFSFEDGGIYVPLLCEPFVATRQPDGTMLIEPVDTRIMCLVFPQREMMISLFFSDLQTLVPLDENTLRLGGSHGDYIIATRIENQN
jgi:hypothetical protein